MMNDNHKVHRHSKQDTNEVAGIEKINPFMLAALKRIYNTDDVIVLMRMQFEPLFIS